MKEKHHKSHKRSPSFERHHSRHHPRDGQVDSDDDERERRRPRLSDDRDRRRSPDNKRHERNHSLDHRDRRRSLYSEKERRQFSGEKKVCRRKQRQEEKMRDEDNIKVEKSPPDHRTKNSKSAAENTSGEKWGKNDENTKKKPMENKAKPDFGLSGKLAEEVNTYNGVVIKYAEPPEAGKPKRRWRLYPFKGDEVLPTLYIHRKSAYLIGRDRKVADMPVDHPSCSKQHAVLQYRIVPYTREDGVKSRRIRPYIIDLESANGTYINNKRIEPKKYVELMERDVIKFAYSSREYVLLHEHSQDDGVEEDDNI
ncbi:smad nuclear-interacting protein 1 [Cimex lectularius]|uniref:FHA domain-containing protein n=1 Tax=Cimex lectularius TaxID=79782 RepID=A0A8I6S8Z0_CIMLE|nr:smad nuclear-interacting protein 1 [Cimex lectularius]